MKRGTLRHGVLRSLISRLANLTPSVVYYAEGWPAKINEKLVDLQAQEEGKQSPISTAAIAICCSLHEQLPKVGDRATMTLTGVEYQGRSIGHFIITARRVSEADADAEFASQETVQP